MDKKYVMIVTSEPGGYLNLKSQLEYFKNNPWDGILEEIVYGDNVDELYGDGHNDGLFYQLYAVHDGKRVGYGSLIPSIITDQILKWESKPMLAYGVLTEGQQFFVIFQHEENDYSVWVNDVVCGLPVDMTVKAIEDFIYTHETEGYSERGTLSDVLRILYSEKEC